MTAPWTQPIAAAAPVSQALQSAVPTLETERLILRAPTLADWSSIEPLWTSQRAAFIGGPFNDEDAWLDFCQVMAGWVLRGISGWALEHRETGETLGLVGLFFDFGDPSLDLGWLLTEAAEGHGYATEAAIAARDYGHHTLKLRGLTSFIAPDNTRSIALATRLGATPGAIQLYDGEEFQIFHHPDPEVLQ